MRRAVAAGLWLTLAASAVAQTADVVNASARWNPPAAELEAIRAACGQSAASDFETCVFDQLARAGVPPGALSFSRRLRQAGHLSLGFLREFRDTGAVSVAYVTYPFGNDPSNRYWLVNGTPDLIDVDDHQLLPLADLARDRMYTTIVNRHGDVAMVSGRRDELSEPQAFSTTGGGQRFIVSYDLRRGCVECEIVGIVKFAFDFEAGGLFKGAALMSVTDRVNASGLLPALQDPSAPPARTLIVRVGETFTINLDADAAPGHAWRAAGEIDPAILTRVEQSDQRRSARNTRAQEVWVFKAAAAGVVPLVFEYARGAALAKTLRFTIVVR